MYVDIATPAPRHVGVVTSSSNLKFEKQVITQLRSGPVALSSFARRVHSSPANSATIQFADLYTLHRDIMSTPVVLHVGPAAVVFYAPEATLCRVPFFRAALQGGFREATEKQMNMPEDTPEIFATFLEHLFTGSYTYTYTPDTTVIRDIPATDLPEGCFHASVYSVAFKYDWQPLVDDAVANFLFVLTKLAGMDIIRLWKAGYVNGLTVAVCEPDGRLVDFVKMLPGLMHGLYNTDAVELADAVSQCPELSYDLMRLLVANHVHE